MHAFDNLGEDASRDTGTVLGWISKREAYWVWYQGTHTMIGTNPELVVRG
jgi:hypothetical protein